MRTLLVSLSLPWLLVACRTQDKVVQADTGALVGADGGDAGWAVRVLSGSITLSGGNDTTHVKGWVN